MKPSQIAALVITGTMLLGGCDLARKSVGEFVGDKDSGKEAPDYVVDDTGTARLLPPDDLQQRKGKEVSNMELATGNAKSMGPLDGWVNEKGGGNGMFLVAAASVAGTVGGDMIRRLELNGEIKEHDYDDEKKGAQGAYIYVPDEMKEAVPSKYIDADGLFSGTICALLPGPDKTVIALAGGTEGGVGFTINPYEDASAFTPLQAFKFPYATNPCRAVYSQESKKLYVIDVVRTESTGGQMGVFVVDIYNDKRGSIGTFYSFDSKYKINSMSVNNFQGIELYKDRLYLLSGNGRFDAEWDAVVYSVPLNTTGEPLFEQLKYTRMNNPVFKTPSCGLSTWNIGAIAIFEKDGKGILMNSGTSATLAYEIGDDGSLTKIDMNAKKPGVQGFNLEDNGRGGLKFSYTPDGNSLLLLPHCRSESNKEKLEGYEAMAFKISSFSLPDLKAEEPVDIGYTALLKSLKNAAYRPMFSMVLRDFAVGPKHIAILGQAASNLSGLGPGSDVTIIDRKKGTNMWFNKPTDMKTAHLQKYGFKLAEGDPKFERTEQNSHAVIWIPTAK